jgi:hypothetical protein
MNTTYLCNQLGEFVVNEVGNTVTTTLLDPSSPDYAAYLEWIEAGNMPEPAPIVEPPAPLTTEQKLEAAGLTVAELRELFGLPAPE